MLMKAKVTFADIGVPSRVKEISGDSLKMGIVMGIADGTLERSTPDKTQTFTGLRGNFAVLPETETDRFKPVRSSIAFFPDFILKPITDLLIDPATGEVRNAQVKFAFEVAAIKANNPQGYSWACKPLVQPAEDDQLTSFIQAATGKRLTGDDNTKAIAQDKSNEPASTTAPLANEPAPAQAASGGGSRKK